MRTLVFSDVFDMETGKITRLRIVVELRNASELPAVMAEIERRYPRFGGRKRNC